MYRRTITCKYARAVDRLYSEGYLSDDRQVEINRGRCSRYSRDTFADQGARCRSCLASDAAAAEAAAQAGYL